MLGLPKIEEAQTRSSAKPVMAASFGEAKFFTEHIAYYMPTAFLVSERGKLERTPHKKLTFLVPDIRE